MAYGNGQEADLSFTADLLEAAAKLRGGLGPSDYKGVALGLIRRWSYLLKWHNWR